MFRRGVTGLLVWGAGGVGAGLVVAAPACGNGAVSYQSPFDASAFFDHALPPSNVGGACGGDHTCRSGLACDDAGACVPGATTPTGSPCVIGAECATGDYCSGGRTCAPAGAGDAGTSCGSDADCAPGLRCNLVGFGAQCQPSGTGDVGGNCTKDGDCYAGLGCAGGVCTTLPPTQGGAPPPLTLSSWGGVACADDGPPVKGYFQVPRGTGDGGAGDDFFRLPFPNDVRLANGHPNLTGFPTPGAGPLGYDLMSLYVTAAQANADGFSTYPTVTIRFSGSIDFTTLQQSGALQWIEFEGTGAQPIGFSWTITTGRNNYVCPNALNARPQEGHPLKPGTTYAFLVNASVKAASGAMLPQDADLHALLAAEAPTDPALSAAYGAYAPLRTWLGANGGVDSVAAATLFTTGHPAALAQKVVAAVNAAPAPTATGWVNCAKGPSPCSQADGERACGAANPAFDELHALATLPIVQSGTEPYAEPSQGGDVAIDANGNVQVARTESVCLSLTVPKGTMPAAGWPLVIYAHGTGGSFRSEITEGSAAALATAKSSAGATVPLAMLGIDQVETGTRRGSSTASPDMLFFNFANPGAARGNPIQGAADQASLLRLAKALTLDASLTGSAIKFGPVTFWGHSQGATEGGIGLPYIEGYPGVALSGEGASLVDVLLTKANPVNVAAVVPALVGDGPIGSYHPALALLQAALDQVDPLNHAVFLAATPPSLVHAKHVFQPYGLGDTYAPPVTQATYAIAAHLGVATAPASVAMPDSIGGIVPATVPASGNLTDGTTAITAFLREYQPSGYDGHFVVFNHADAKADLAAFLADLAQGQVPKVGR